MIALEKNIAYTPVFDANRKAYLSGSYRVIANEGGTRSSKTFSLSQLMIALAISGKKISVCSPSLPHLKRGARRDILNQLQAFGIYSDNDFNKTDQIYNFPSGGYLEFFGIDNSNKVRGPGREILYINESNLVSHENFKQLSVRTTDCIFIDYNPADEFNWVYDIADKQGNKKIVSTYRNNLANLSQSQIEEIEGYRETDLNFWNVYGLGLRGSSEATIYKHWKTYKIDAVGERIYGLDFGYTNPLALVEITLVGKGVYAKQLVYERNLDIENFESGNNKETFIEKMKYLGIPKNAPIYCDHDPGKISQLKKHGYNAIPANKDVKNGILALKSRPLFLHETSVEMLKEFKSYKWRQDINGSIVDGEVVKINDHSCDAVRMAVYTHLSNNVQQVETPTHKKKHKHGSDWKV